MISDLAANIVGISGSILIVAAYAYNVYATKVDPFVYNGANLAGAGLLTISLMVHFNLASLLLEIVWIGIALVGLWKAWQRRVEQRP